MERRLDVVAGDPTLGPVLPNIPEHEQPEADAKDRQGGAIHGGQEIVPPPVRKRGKPPHVRPGRRQAGLGTGVALTVLLENLLGHLTNPGKGYYFLSMTM